MSAFVAAYRPLSSDGLVQKLGSQSNQLFHIQLIQLNNSTEHLIAPFCSYIINVSTVSWSKLSQIQITTQRKALTS